MRYLPLLITCLAVLAICLFGCSSVPVKQDPNVVYKKDIKFCVKDVACYDGIGVVPAMSEYPLEVSPTEEDQIDRIVFNSCHRNKGFYPTSDELVPLGFFKSFWQSVFGKKASRRGFEYLYKPMPGIENSAGCPLYIFILDTESESHAWAVMIPEDPEYQLKGTLICDGAVNNYNGVSACEGRVGTIQRIKFSQPVQARVRGDSCQPVRYNQGFYDFDIGKGACTYLFTTQSGQKHVMHTWGYSGLRFKKDKPQ